MKNRLIKRLSRLLCLIFVLVASSCGGLTEESLLASTAPPQNVPTSEPLIIHQMADDIDKYVSRMTSGGYFSGAVLVVYRGTRVIAKGYGWADKERGVKNDLTTKFRISSLSKSFTAMAILLLEGQGRLETEDYVCSYLLSCPEIWRKLTIHQLLTHTSGIPDYVRTPGFLENELQQHRSTEELLALVAGKPLLIDPGSRFVYSNSNYLVLGVIIGRLANPKLPVEMAYGQYLEEHVLGPLHMESTGIEQCEAGSTALAKGYITDSRPSISCDPSNFFAMGDLYATVPDLYLWGLALDNDTLLSASIRERIFIPYVSTTQYHTSYGYGWYITQIGESERVWHDGATPGYRSFFQWGIDEDTVVVILSNFEVAPVIVMGQEISAVLIRRSKDASR